MFCGYSGNFSILIFFLPVKFITILIWFFSLNMGLINVSEKYRSELNARKLKNSTVLLRNDFR